jgi:hypothetical protein
LKLVESSKSNIDKSAKGDKDDSVSEAKQSPTVPNFVLNFKTDFLDFNDIKVEVIQLDEHIAYDLSLKLLPKSSQSIVLDG